MPKNFSGPMKFKSLISCFIALSLGASLPATAQVEVDINFDLRHVVGNQDTFDREKFIVIHADATETDYNGQLGSLNTLLNDLDVNYGRETGRMRFIGDNVLEDPNRPGFADPSSITDLSNLVNQQYADNPGKFPTQFKGRTIVAAQDRPFFPDGALTSPVPFAPETTATPGFAYSEENNPNIDDDFGTATGEFMAQFLRDAYGSGGVNGAPRPTWVEVINEPFFPLVDFAPAGEEASVDEIFELHRTVAREIKEVNPNMLVGGFTNAFPDLEHRRPGSDALFGQWDERWRRFIDEAGEDMDFYSIHLYDFHSIGSSTSSNTVGGGVSASSREILRKGGNIEATLDMIEHYNTIRWGSVKPWVISEYGGQLNDFYSQPWSPWRDWLIMKSFSSMMMQFMERPDVIQKTVPFTLARADFLFGAVAPDFVYPWRMLRGPNEPDSLDRNNLAEASFTEIIKFYQLWSDVNGTRVDTISSDLDIMTDAYVNAPENKAYVILNSLDETDLTVNLNELGLGGRNVTGVRIKQLFLGSDDNPQLTDQQFANVPSSVLLREEATMVIEYSFDQAPAVNQTSTEQKIYATTYNQPIAANQANVFTVPNVNLGAQGEAVLRIGIGRDSSLTRIPEVRVNGNLITVPADYRGDVQAQRDIFPLGLNLFFGMLEAPVPYQFLSAGNNIVEVTFSDGSGASSGAISSLALQTFGFTRAVARTGGSSSDNPVTNDGARERSLVFDNRASFIPAGQELPVFQIGEEANINISYATQVSNGVEEDLTYVATQIRQLDANRNTVATSVFNVAVPGSASNSDTTSFTYAIPSNFETGANGDISFAGAIPQTADLPAGHQLQLLLFLSVDDNAAFAGANTDIIIGDIASDSRERSLVFNNLNSFVPAGETLPRVQSGQELAINISYATGIESGVEEDLAYIASQIRQIDQNGNTVGTSEFNVAVPGSAANSGTVDFTYTVPTNFATGVNNSTAFTGEIPQSSSLPQGHRLELLLFLSSDDNAFFANANTDLNIGSAAPVISDRQRSLNFDNIASFVPVGQTLPQFEIGQSLTLNLSYATGISNGIEEDLTYVATQIRQFDNNNSIVATSAFNVAVAGDADNSGTVNVAYQVPSNFATGASNANAFTGAIPSSANLPAGHRLELLIFLSVDDNAGFADANTEVSIGGPSATVVQNRARSINIDNRASFVPQGSATLTVNFNQQLDIQLSYATALNNGVEEDLTYAATFVRLLDGSNNVINSSTFTVVVPDSGENAATVNYQYVIPTNFTDGAVIPRSSALLSGQRLELVTFMSVNNNAAFADANETLTIN